MLIGQQHIDFDCENWRQNGLTHFTLNWAFLRFSDFKRENYSFSSPIPSMRCCAAVWATYRKQQTPQLWIEGTGKRCGFFCALKLPYLNTMSQQVCRHCGCLFFGFKDSSALLTEQHWHFCENNIKNVHHCHHCIFLSNKSLSCTGLEKNFLFFSYFGIKVPIFLRMSFLFSYFPIFWVSFATWHPALDTNLSNGQWFTPGIALSNVWTIDFPFFLDEGWCIWRVLHCNYYSGDP